MRFEPRLREGRLLRRYKRFLADVVTDEQQEVTMHCANTGAMTGCAEPGSKVWFSTSDNRKRKYAHSWELVENTQGDRICINTARPNQLVGEALADGTIDLGDAGPFSREIPIPHERGRFDFGNDDIVIEVKSVTLGIPDGGGAFPDAVSQRATRHVQALATSRAEGYRAVLIFLVPHTGIEWVRPADEVDTVYGKALRDAAKAGVEVRAYGCSVGPDELCVRGELPVRLDY